MMTPERKQLALEWLAEEHNRADRHSGELRIAIRRARVQRGRLKTHLELEAIDMDIEQLCDEYKDSLDECSVIVHITQEIAMIIPE